MSARGDGVTSGDAWRAPCAAGAEGRWQLRAGHRIRRRPVLGSACLPEAQTSCCCLTHTHVAAAWLPGAACRYYVEDHSNQLVRTFTGNLTKMLSQMPGSLGKLAAGEAGAAHGSRAATAGSSSGAGAAAGREWSATRLMQVRCWAHACMHAYACTVAGWQQQGLWPSGHTHGLIRRGGMTRGQNMPVVLTVTCLG